MVDLHLHLDGSLSPEFILKQAVKDSVVLPADTMETLLPYLTAQVHCSSLNEYLEKFDLPLLVLQTADSLDNAVYDLLNRLSLQGLTHAEIRFAPQLHCQKGLSQEEVIEATLQGLSRGILDFQIKAGLILCCMRGSDNYSANQETLRLAKKYFGKGVLALDLAGAEGLFPTENFSDIFYQAAKSDIPFTIHAGEAAGPDSIRKAIEFGACRIGHGVHCIQDPSLVDFLIMRQIPLEMCPTSNLQTKAVNHIEAHPILKLLDLGVMVTVNTDNMTVSNTTLKNEFSLLTALHMNLNQTEYLIENALKATFLK